MERHAWSLFLYPLTPLAPLAALCSSLTHWTPQSIISNAFLVAPSHPSLPCPSASLSPPKSPTPNIHFLCFCSQVAKCCWGKSHNWADFLHYKFNFQPQLAPQISSAILLLNPNQAFLISLSGYSKSFPYFKTLCPHPAHLFLAGRQLPTLRN